MDGVRQKCVHKVVFKTANVISSREQLLYRYIMQTVPTTTANSEKVGYKELYEIDRIITMSTMSNNKYTEKISH